MCRGGKGEEKRKQRSKEKRYDVQKKRFVFAGIYFEDSQNNTAEETCSYQQKQEIGRELSAEENNFCQKHEQEPFNNIVLFFLLHLDDCLQWG